MTIAAISVLIVACLVTAAVFACRRATIRERAAREDGSFGRRFVWVEDDGSVRELTADECAYLNTEFHPGDGARPYIKRWYVSRTPDDRLSGFLLRSEVPRGAAIRP